MTGWERWANDPESFERAVLADLEQRVSWQMTVEALREPARRELRGIRLNGSYPNTVIVVSYLDLRIEFTERPEDDPQGRRPDISLARLELGWEPRVPLDTGLERMVAWASEAWTT